MEKFKKLSREELRNVVGGLSSPDKCDVNCDSQSAGKEISDCSVASVTAACGGTANATCSCH
jgi:hypothetical protein